MSDVAKRRASLVLNAAIVVMFVFAWCEMAFGWGGTRGALSSLGLGTLKYFTIQSNLLSAVVSAACVVFYLRHAGERLPELAHTLRLVATTVVGLTLVTVEAFLAPMLYGYASMHAGANLWFHLLLPLMAMVSYCVFDKGFVREGEWALNIRSVIVFGRMRVVEDRERAIELVRKLSCKYTDDETYIEGEIKKTGKIVLVYELIPEHMTGKLVNES